jgi:hypothetical protein
MWSVIGLDLRLLANSGFTCACAGARVFAPTFSAVSGKALGDEGFSVYVVIG